MAGNLVKWWKHKILGGYKQFSVQECTTDSEELMYHQVRASSSCSAPPDLLLVSDRENNMPLRSPVVNIIAATTTAPATTTTSPSSGINACHITSAANNNQHRYQQQQQQQKLQHHHHQQQQQQHHQHQVTTQQLSLAYNNGCKDIIGGINAAGGSGSGVGGGGSKHQKQSVVMGSSSTSKHGHQQQQQTPDMQPSSVTHDVVDGQPLEAQTNNHSSTKQTHHHTQQQQQHHNHNTHHQQPQRSEEHIRLEEFTCDVSVEGGKSSQPLQFSFTFYDLDGHHGKITKDDIVGIVYTIYESIGKSVVVPHSGSKTINVRLTVSPEGKTKATKTKKTLDHHSLNLNQKPTAVAALASNNTQATRRLHRYRPRKLIKSDEEDDDSNSDKERDLNLAHILAHKAASKAHKLGKLKTSEQHCCAQQMAHQQQQQQQPALNDLPNSPLDTAAIYDNLKASSPLEACRECLAAAADETRNAAATSPLVTAATTTTSPSQFPAASSKTTNEAYMKHVASTRIKMLRKSRKQKHQDCLETRQRSLSVGNETCWKNRHLQTKHSNTQQHMLWQAEQHLNNSVVVGGGNSNGNGNGGDMVDGVQLRNPLKNAKSMMASSSSSAHKRNSAECWKTALNRNDLISIIRESMEKNRLCFQLNGKPQANVSPIRQQTTNTNTNNPHQQTQPHNPQVGSNSSKHTQQHPTTPIAGSQHQQQQLKQRQRSNTVSKIPTLIANHNNTQSAAISPQHHHPQRSSSCANTISNNCNTHSHSHSHDTSLANEPYSHTNSSNSSNNHHYHHHQPHIPIYHQQMAINPAVIAAQNALLTATASGNVGSSLLQQHGKMNLCGYDSFLHATICGGGLSHSPPPPPPPPPAPLPAQTSINHTSLNTQISVSSNTNLSQHQHQHQHQQQIATVQPIMAQNASTTSKHLSLAVTPQQLKSGKILRQTSNSTPSQSQHQQHQHHSFTTNTTQNSPQYHGYQRLPSSSKHNLSALHLLSPNTEKPSLSELDKWRRDQVKSYDQLLYAKLSEKLQQTNLVSTSSNARDCNQRRKQRVTRQRRATALQQDQATTTNDSLPSMGLSNSICLREPTIPIVGDPAECENLLGQTSDEDINSPQDVNPLQLKAASENRQVAEATLVDIDKITDELTAQKANLNLNVDTLLSVDETQAVHNLHSLHQDDLEIDEDLDEEEEELDEELEVVESGRNSNNSNNSSNANNSANTNTATNNGANNSTSSLIHRYVHEHIHHHYHHFEEKEE